MITAHRHSLQHLQKVSQSQITAMLTLIANNSTLTP